LRSRGASFLIFGGCSIAAATFACGSIDLRATQISEEPPPDNSNQGIRSPTFYVSGQRLFDPCAKPVLLRGVNEMVTYIPGKSGADAFREIAKTKANSVRIYWRTSDSDQELDTVLRDAEAQQLLPIVYVFNRESEPGRSAPTPLDDAVNYWTRPEIVRVVQAHKTWLIIALREKGESDPSESNWLRRYGDAIVKVRSHGIEVPLAIDAPLTGSDTQTLLDVGHDLIATDRNLLLNVNLGLSSDSADTFAAQLGAAHDLGLPLLVGELSGWSQTPEYDCKEPFAYSTVLAAAQAKQTGWLAWSWGFARNQICGRLDMAQSGLYDNLQDWGLAVASLDENSIERTSVKPHYVPGGSCD